MKMKKNMIAILMSSILTMAYAEQKVEFSLESYSYGNDSKKECLNSCKLKYKSRSASDMIKEGYEIVSSYPKSYILEDFKKIPDAKRIEFAPGSIESERCELSMDLNLIKKISGCRDIITDRRCDEAFSRCSINGAYLYLPKSIGCECRGREFILSKK